MQVPQPSKKPIASWRSYVALSGCITVATVRVPSASLARAITAVKASHGVAGRQPPINVDVNTIRACDEMRRRMARPSVVLPEPDSPTMPSVSPRRTSMLTPSTALSFFNANGGNPFAGLATTQAYIGKAGYVGDPTWFGSIDQVNIHDTAFDGTEVLASFTASPVVIPEPSVALLGILGALGLLRRRR